MQLVSYFKRRYPQAIMFHIPNQGISGIKGKIYGAKMKKMGLVAGVPDLFIAHPGKHDKRGLFIEMKSPRGKVSQKQKDVINYLGMYYDKAVCYSYEQAVDTVDEYMG